MNVDQVFTAREGGEQVWRCMVAGRVFGDWPNRGAAAAGMATEQRRAAIRNHERARLRRVGARAGEGDG